MEVKWLTHRGHSGDIVYALPTIYAYATEFKCILALSREHDYNVLYRLLKLQPYIYDIKKITEPECSQVKEWISLNSYKRISMCNLSKHLVLCHLEPNGKTFDLSKPWIENIEPTYASDIVVNRGLDHHDKEGVDWTLLRPFENKCKFIGYRNEYDTFVKQYQCNIEYYPTKDALEMISVIKGCKLFIGNSSLAMALAEGIRHPRCMELYYARMCAGNCDPNNNEGYWTNLTTELIENCILK